MVGILIVSHGAFGEALIHCAGHVLGRAPLRVQQLGVTVQDDPEDLLARGRKLLRELDEGDGVLILTDIVGATPYNVVSRLVNPGRVEGLSGASLPMLIRALTYRDQPLETVVQKAISAARDGTVHVAASRIHGPGRI